MSLQQAVQPDEHISPTEATELLAENQRLKREVQGLQAKLDLYREVTQSGRSIFSHLFGPRHQTPVRLIAARIAAGDSLPYAQSRLINQGTKKDVANGQFAMTRLLLTDRSKQMADKLAVLSGEAFAGRIVESSAYSARLHLLVDRGFKIQAQIRRTLNPVEPRKVQIGDRITSLTAQTNQPVNVIAYGDGADGMVVKQVSQEHNILPGDMLITYPNDPMLPVSVTIGEVIDVQKDSQHPGRCTLKVKPAADLTALRNVFVVVPNSAPVRTRRGR